MRAFLLILLLSFSIVCQAQLRVYQPSHLQAYLDSTGILTGKLYNSLAGEYYIQVFKWNKWVTMDTIKATIGDSVGFKMTINLHSGKNIVRIKPKYEGLRSCNPFAQGEVLSCKKSVSLERMCSWPIAFTDSTDYEVYDKKGSLVERGRDNKVDPSAYPQGVYYLNFDNKMTEFILGESNKIRKRRTKAYTARGL
jgi:hypothetical protein